MSNELIDRIDNMLSSMASTKETLIGLLGEEGKQGYELAVNLLQDCKAALTQQQAAEPVAWTLRWPHDIRRGTVNCLTTFKTKERAREYADNCTNGESIVVAPLFLYPPKPAAQLQVPEGDAR